LDAQEMPHVCGELEWYREAAAFASILRGEGFFVAEKGRQGSFAP